MKKIFQHLSVQLISLSTAHSSTAEHSVYALGNFECDQGPGNGIKTFYYTYVNAIRYDVLIISKYIQPHTSYRWIVPYRILLSGSSIQRPFIASVTSCK